MNMVQSLCGIVAQGVSMKGYYVRGGVVYVDGFLDGKRVRKSTGLPVSKKNIDYVVKHGARILQASIDEKTSVGFAEFGRAVIKNIAVGKSLDYQKTLKAGFEKKILPFFKSVAFEDIRPIMIEQWQSNLGRKLSPNTVRKYVNILRIILQKARSNELCSHNPFDGVTLARTLKPQSRGAYTSEEITKLIQTADGWFKTFLLVAFGTGMRTGEILALQWKDINFGNQTITVRRNIAKGRVVETTKTHTIRTIDMLDIVAEAVMRLHVNKAHDTWVFPSKLGTHFSESKNILRYHFKPLLEKVGVEYKTLYASRHSFISTMLNHGMDLMWVQNMAGHAESTTTLKHYAQYQNGDKKRLQKANDIISINYKTWHTSGTQGKVS